VTSLRAGRKPVSQSNVFTYRLAAEATAY